MGVFFGDLVYSYLAYRLGRATGRNDVTAMPLGLDTPSSIGLAFAVIGPAYVATKDPVLTWQIGMTTLFMIGVVKLVVSFFGLTVLSNGFVLTAMLWGSIVALIIDQRVHMAAAYALCCGLLTLFGLMHSVLPTGEIYLPWHAPNHVNVWMAAGYGVLGCALFFQKKMPDYAHISA